MKFGFLFVSPDESLKIQYGHSAAAGVRPFKFGMWVYMGNAKNAIVL